MLCCTVCAVQGKELLSSSPAENVNEYLIQTATVQDRAQLQKLKALFEKKNQKAAQQMAHQQRKLEAYTRRAKDLETSGLPYRPPKEVLKDVGLGLR